MKRLVLTGALGAAANGQTSTKTEFTGNLAEERIWLTGEYYTISESRTGD